MEILLVDDDYAHCLLANRALKKYTESVSIKEFHSASKVILEIKENHLSDLSLAIIDLKLDHESGITVLKAIRNNTILKALPVLIVSTSDLSEHIKEAYLAGANCYLAKGQDPKIYSDNLKKAVQFFSTVNAIQ